MFGDDDRCIMDGLGLKMDALSRYLGPICQACQRQETMQGPLQADWLAGWKLDAAEEKTVLAPDGDGARARGRTSFATNDRFSVQTAGSGKFAWVVMRC